MTTALQVSNQRSAKTAKISLFKELMALVTCVQMDLENKQSMELLTSVKNAPFSTRPVIRIDKSVFTITSALN